MNTYKYLIIALFIFLSLILVGSVSTNGGDNPKPNIILIMADDLGYETLASYGGTYQTPNLDKMASEGMRFTHAYAMPLCTPSRVQIMTGKYNFRNYIGFGLLDPGERTFGHLMKEAGYVTGIAGKWQLLGNDKQQKMAGKQRGSWPVEAGFDEYALWQVDEHGDRYKDPLIRITGGATQVYEDQYGPDVFRQFIGNFMETHKSEPFFMYYPMVLTHGPFHPTPANQNFNHFDNKGSVNGTTYFDDMVNYMDSIVGQILDKVKELDIERNTLILFIGDNGTGRRITTRMKNGQRITGQKGHPTEYGTHVPFIAYWKDHIKGGQINSNLIDFTDFLPSLMDAAQFEPDNFYTDGISFYPQLLGKATEPREWVFGHYDPQWSDWPLARYVHGKRWKLYGNGKIYNIQQDPMEQDSVSKDQLSTKQQKIIEKFQTILKQMN